MEPWQGSHIGGNWVFSRQKETPNPGGRGWACLRLERNAGREAGVTGMPSVRRGGATEFLWHRLTDVDISATRQLSIGVNYRSHEFVIGLSPMILHLQRDAQALERPNGTNLY